MTGISLEFANQPDYRHVHNTLRAFTVFVPDLKTINLKKSSKSNSWQAKMIPHHKDRSLEEVGSFHDSLQQNRLQLFWVHLLTTEWNTIEQTHW